MEGVLHALSARVEADITSSLGMKTNYRALPFKVPTYTGM